MRLYANLGGTTEAITFRPSNRVFLFEVARGFFDFINPSLIPSQRNEASICCRMCRPVIRILCKIDVNFWEEEMI